MTDEYNHVVRKGLEFYKMSVLSKTKGILIWNSL